MGRNSSGELTVLSIEKTDGVATLWLDRAAKMNAMGPAFFAELPVAMESLGRDPDARVVLVAARGEHFSVGLDLKAMASLLAGTGNGRDAAQGGDRLASGDGQKNPTGSPQPSMAARASAARREIIRLQASITAVAECPKPVIAAIHGYCIGGGVDLAAACDIRIASADALFSVREARMAIVADLGSLQRLPYILSAGHLAELAFTGKDISAERAMRIGLVNDVYPDRDSLFAAARELAHEIAANSPLAVQGTKTVLAASRNRQVAEGLDYVATWNAGFLQSDDLVEAMMAFLAKRKPTFEGR